jgi:long-chain acyl-CoA synthetase
MNNVPSVKEVLVCEEKDSIIAEIFFDEEMVNAENVIKSEIDKLNKKLPSYTQIASIKFRNTEFPKTTTKKIKRNYEV